MKLSELLSDESKWTKHVNARDKHNNATGPSSPNAVKWCLYGAMCRCQKINGKGFTRSYMAKISAFIRLHHYNMSIPAFNDAPTTTFADIQQIIRELDL